jgi:hypothetical protein
LPTIFPAQDSMVRGELSPRLHARASLDLYRVGLSICENFLTLPHGGLRKRGGTYFVSETKTQARTQRMLGFIFSADQAYMIELGHLYLRLYAYGARVGTIELVTPWPEEDLDGVQMVQSADVMWLTHPDYPPQTLTREAALTWTLEEFEFLDGPYKAINLTPTTLTPASTAHITPAMTNNTTPAGYTVSSSNASANAYQAFDRERAQTLVFATGSNGYLRVQLPAGKVADAYWITAAQGASIQDMFTEWEFQGSNDGSTWVTLDFRTAETGWSASETRHFEFTNETAYSYYQLNVRGGGGPDGDPCSIGELAIHERAQNQTAFNLTASSIVGINDGVGFKTTDVGRSIRLLGSDSKWRWAKIIARTSTTVVTIQLYGHALPDTSPITNWRMSAFEDGDQPSSVTLFEERLALAQDYSIFASKTGDFDDFATGEKDDDALEFLNAGGGQANKIVWMADADGFLLVATAGGIRALSGAGIDEALTPTSFKNRKSRTFGAAPLAPIDAGSSFVYVTRNRRTLAELTQTQIGRFQSEEISQVSEHIPKKGIVEVTYQSDPDPMIWFPLDTGELGGYTHQPSQEVRGMHRHIIGGVAPGGIAQVENALCTPGQGGPDDLWLIVRRTINALTKRYIEIMQPPIEYGSLDDAFHVDCGLTYTGSATNSLSGLGHLEGQTVDVFYKTAAGKWFVAKGRTVSAGAITLPNSAQCVKAHVGLPYTSTAITLELDVGGKDGSLMGRRKKVSKVIISLFETDVSGLQVRSNIRGAWETARIITNVPSDGSVSLYTGDIEVPIDDSWAGKGRIELRHTNPTPCTIRAISPAFDYEP